MRSTAGGNSPKKLSDFAAWDRDGRPEHCQACFEQQLANHVPVPQRTLRPLPCPEHGDPRILAPENYQAIEIYRRLPARSWQEGEDVKTARDLDIQTINILAEWYQITDRLTLLGQLEAIHGVLNRHDT